ncbi:hypothetical protein SLP22_0024 [Salmonella phage BAU.Micro_SLP-22]
MGSVSRSACSYPKATHTQVGTHWPAWEKKQRL